MGVMVEESSKPRRLACDPVQLNNRQSTAGGVEGQPSFGLAATAMTMMNSSTSEQLQRPFDGEPEAAHPAPGGQMGVIDLTRPLGPYSYHQPGFGGGPSFSFGTPRKTEPLNRGSTGVMGVIPMGVKPDLANLKDGPDGPNGKVSLLVPVFVTLIFLYNAPLVCIVRSPIHCQIWARRR